MMSSKITSEAEASKVNDNITFFKVLFLSSDTGGGHRASAEALGKQFESHFPGSTYKLMDVWSLDGVFPYKTLVGSYKYMSAHPRQWGLFYHLSNTAPSWVFTHVHARLMCEKKILQRMESYNPDLVVSVHPTMNYVPLIATQQLSKTTNKHIPFFTVVTDLGSGHHTWFERNAERVYVASERMRSLARRRGFVPKQKIVMTGLPIRHDFVHQAERIGNRSSEAGKNHQWMVRQQLGLAKEKRAVLVMGGGEGVGSLSKIVDELYLRFVLDNMNADIYVVCGRNANLQNDLSRRDWTAFLEDKKASKAPKLLRRNRSNKDLEDISLNHTTSDENSDVVVEKKPNVSVVALGFVNEMAEYMVAADVLVTKAGPGTIAEAAAVGLPIMLTSYLPGQEAGNVKVVVEAGFGDYCKAPKKIAQRVSSWLQDEKLLTTMSSRAMEVGQPTAASDIVKDIGQITESLKMTNK